MQMGGGAPGLPGHGCRSPETQRPWWGGQAGVCWAHRPGQREPEAGVSVLGTSGVEVHPPRVRVRLLQSRGACVHSCHLLCTPASSRCAAGRGSTLVPPSLCLQRPALYRPLSTLTHVAPWGCPGRRSEEGPPAEGTASLACAPNSPPRPSRPSPPQEHSGPPERLPRPAPSPLCLSPPWV